jgi:uncharacterized protein
MLTLGEEILATATTATRPPLPPFTRDPPKVALAYAIDSRWRNRSEFINGRNEIIAFLSHKWARELDYRLIKELWAFAGQHRS